MASTITLLNASSWEHSDLKCSLTTVGVTTPSYLLSLLKHCKEVSTLPAIVKGANVSFMPRFNSVCGVSPHVSE